MKWNQKEEEEKELRVHKLSNFNTNFNSLRNFVNMKVVQVLWAKRSNIDKKQNALLLKQFPDRDRNNQRPSKTNLLNYQIFETCTQNVQFHHQHGQQQQQQRLWATSSSLETQD